MALEPSPQIVPGGMEWPDPRTGGQAPVAENEVMGVGGQGQKGQRLRTQRDPGGRLDLEQAAQDESAEAGGRGVIAVRHHQQAGSF